METENNQLFKVFKRAVIQWFNLRHDQADEEQVINSITRNSDFVGANLWTLIFAILIASIGLNMNSTAVVIGAMLISPLMGPIMGVGLGMGTEDFDLVKKGIRNLLIATVISIITSAIYFWITPLHEAKSELLARTTPTLWDVLIAFFGGLAGVVAATRNEKSNAIPGVAIATALMPPLCTAGYGLATANYYYFLGALYLYCINSIFICISTFLIIRLMKFKRRSFEEHVQGRKVSRYILLTIFITILPSIYLTYKIVNKSLFESRAKQFVEEQFQFDNALVVSKNFSYDDNPSKINVLLIGKRLPETLIDSIRRNLKTYDLGNAELLVRQGLNSKQEIDMEQIRASILNDVFRHDSLKVQSVNQTNKLHEIPDLTEELKALLPGFRSYSASRVVENYTDKSTDTLILVVIGTNKPVRALQRTQLNTWLIERTKSDTIKLIFE
ncbi:TIGR00341 family protein [uncultured Fluviicola sp.]|uniref:TIGR00341 family protein n=1 Tax=uncultured Fluviicola sp. TaxID=463303 RepID=UPI0025D3409B|nr:TIGR00341 family protein [uncultured Fluviicola sp.]